MEPFVTPDHPAALVLADHIAPRRRWASELTQCWCGWSGDDGAFPEHQADMLEQAGLLAPRDDEGTDRG